MLESAYKDSKNCFYCLKVWDNWRSCEFRSLDSIDLQLQTLQLVLIEIIFLKIILIRKVF